MCMSKQVVGMLTEIVSDRRGVFVVLLASNTFFHAWKKMLCSSLPRLFVPW